MIGARLLGVIPQVPIPQEAQWAGAVVMIVIVLAIAWYAQRKWREERTAQAPAS
jgi:hypothetical protein